MPKRQFLDTIFFFHFFRFLGPRSFRMTPKLHGLDDFLHVNQNMPKRPLSDKIFLKIFFEKYRSKEEF